jgi:hypothetical protein
MNLNHRQEYLVRRLGRVFSEGFRIVSESEFWQRLQLHLNRHVNDWPMGLTGWCDGFTPKRYIFDGPLPCISGRVWFLSGRDAAELDFTLTLKRAVGSLSDIEWATLLPSDNAVGWLSLDSFHSRIDIDPSAEYNAPFPDRDDSPK